MHMAFELPPPAIHGPSGSSLSETTKHNPSHPGADYSHPLAPSPRSIFPSQSADTVKSRRRSSAAKEGQESSFALPPPPTRSRKIIQMKPRQQDDAFEAVSEAKDMAKSGAKGGAAKNAAGGATTGTKKKQPSATSAAGRKIARKTAHSLIERRRRSKMNEEFAVLKSMIPACTGEMHKLAILQVSSGQRLQPPPLVACGRVWFILMLTFWWRPRLTIFVTWRTAYPSSKRSTARTSLEMTSPCLRSGTFTLHSTRSPRATLTCPTRRTLRRRYLLAGRTTHTSRQCRLASTARMVGAASRRTPRERIGDTIALAHRPVRRQRLALSRTACMGRAARQVLLLPALPSTRSRSWTTRRRPRY